jgi:putative addiction module CopG family antidote
MTKEHEAHSAQKLDITLPNEMAQMVKAKVSSGEYATENEVILEGLRALQVQERALEHWLRTEVVAAYDELKANPASAIPTEEVRRRLAARLDTSK